MGWAAFVVDKADSRTAEVALVVERQPMELYTEPLMPRHGSYRVRTLNRTVGGGASSP